MMSFQSSHATAAGVHAPALQHPDREDEEDILDLYFYLTSPNCPIFASGVNHRAISTSSATAPVASSHSVKDVAIHFGIDLRRLAALREAAGGSFRVALAYLEQIIPTGSDLIAAKTHFNESSSSSSSTNTSATLTVNRYGNGNGHGIPFEPFQSMDELIRVVRGMAQRDALAGRPPPTLRQDIGQKITSLRNTAQGQGRMHSSSSSSLMPGHLTHPISMSMSKGHDPSNTFRQSEIESDREAMAMALREERRARDAARELLLFSPQTRVATLIFTISTNS